MYELLLDAYDQYPGAVVPPTRELKRIARKIVVDRRKRVWRIAYLFWRNRI